MKQGNKQHIFWISYSDLITSLFFVMLLLFVLSIALFVDRDKQLIKAATEAKREKMAADSIANVSKQQLDKIKEIEEATKNLDSSLFTYNSGFKWHQLKFSIQFKKSEFELDSITVDKDKTICKIEGAGREIAKRVKEAHDKNGAYYLLVINGHASTDGDPYNNRLLSYKRALSIYQYWSEKGILKESPYCEIVVGGSGSEAQYALPGEENRRFTIHIIPKPGVISK